LQRYGVRLHLRGQGRDRGRGDGVGAVHGKEVHGITELTPEMVEKVKPLIRDE